MIIYTMEKFHISLWNITKSTIWAMIGVRKQNIWIKCNYDIFIKRFTL